MLYRLCEIHVVMTAIFEIMRSDLPSWKFSSCDRSCRFWGTMKPPNIMSLMARLQISVLVTFLIRGVRQTMTMTRKLPTTAKRMMMPIKTTNTASPVASDMAIRRSCRFKFQSSSISSLPIAEGKKSISLEGKRYPCIKYKALAYEYRSLQTSTFLYDITLFFFQR